MSEPLDILVLFPLLTAAQGDEGNARVLRHRAALRGVTCRVSTHHAGPVPAADVYLLGGLMEVTVPELARRLRVGDLAAAVAGGAVVLAVGAGFDVIGRTFQTEDGREHAGVGLLDVVSAWSSAKAEGPVITRPNPAWELGALSGYESHRTTITLGPQVRPLAGLELGVGNGGEAPHAVEGVVEGAVAGRVVGTHIHGPVLARNADLADLLLGWALPGPLEPAPAHLPDELRQRRIAEDRADPTGWGGRHYGTPTLRSRLRRR